VTAARVRAPSALAAYDREDRRTRLHVRGRWRSSPMVEIETLLPRTGWFLDYGCGHGVFTLHLCATAPERQVCGVDVDAAKIDIARRAAATMSTVTGGAGSATFEVVERPWLPPPTPSWDVIVINDVLYLLGHAHALEVVRAAAGALAPGGVLAIKEIDVRPRWKFQWARFQEIVATRVVRVTAGEQVAFVPPDDLAAAMAESGLTVTRRRLDRHRLHPHLLLMGRR